MRRRAMLLIYFLYQIHDLANLLMMNQHSSMPDYYHNGRGHYAYDQFGVASFSYRPAVQLPMRPTAELGLSELQHQHQQHHQSSPAHHHIVNNNHPVHPHQHPHHHHQQQRHLQQHQHPQPQQHIQQNMSNWQTDDDLAEFQELSNKYEPEATASKHHKPYQPCFLGNSF